MVSLATLTQGTSEWLADSYEPRTIAAFQEDLPGPCCGIADLGGGKLAWTVLKPGKVEVYDVEVGFAEWSTEGLDRPQYIALVPGESTRIWVTSPDNNCIYWLDAGGGALDGGIPVTDPETDETKPVLIEAKGLSSPRGLTFWQNASKTDPDSDIVSGFVWVADSGNDRLVAFHPESGEAVRTMGQGLIKCPVDVQAIDLEKMAVVSRTGGHVFAQDGSLLFRFNCYMMIGNAVTFDARAEHGLLAVADEYTDRICLFCGHTGSFVRSIAGTGMFSEGTGAHKSLAFHIGEEGYGCKLFFADYKTRRLCKLDVGRQEKPTLPPKPKEAEEEHVRFGKTTKKWKFKRLPTRELDSGSL